MWSKDGTKLTGWYGTWAGREVELAAKGINRGKWSLIHNEEASPGSAWEKIQRPYRFGYPPMRYWLDVDESEVSDAHSIEVCGVIDDVKVWVVAEDDIGRLAVQADGRTPPNCRDDLARKYGLEYYDDRRSFAFGWVPAKDIHDITIERRDIAKD